MGYRYRGVDQLFRLEGMLCWAARLTLNSPTLSFQAREPGKTWMLTDPFGSCPLLADAHRQSVTLARAFWDGSYRPIRFVAHLAHSLNYMQCLCCGVRGSESGAFHSSCPV